MKVEVLQAKISKAVVTAANMDYKGSITIDQDILDEMGVFPYQTCDVNSKGGFRGKTYILSGERGTGCVEANGALAAHIFKGDVVHINVYCSMPACEACNWEPTVVETNKP